MRTERQDTVVVGGGQSGLATSFLLGQRDRDHVILEQQQQVAASWRQRWDSFTLVTPNWQLCLPGFGYQGDDPEGFLTRDEVVAHVEDFAASFTPPLRLGVTVTKVAPAETGDGYVVHTTDGAHHADNVVIAAGTFQRPHVPSAARTLAGGMAQLHSSDYRNPDTLPDGGVLVVGSGQSGCQIAQELHEHGRRVALSTSAVGRLPRRYRGRDGMDWAVALGMIDESVDDLDSLDERFAPNPQISGRDGGRDINLHAFARDGITLLGHLDDIQDRRVSLRADLHDNLAVGDTMAAQFRTGVDTFVEKAGLDAPGDVVPELTDGFQQDIITELDLAAEGITTVIWATGYRWDYSWIDLPIFDDHGYPMQRRGVVAEYPGLYFVGLSWLHTRKSGLFLGVGDDAAHVVDHLVG